MLGELLADALELGVDLRHCALQYSCQLLQLSENQSIYSVKYKCEPTMTNFDPFQIYHV